jgi:hypothetical protein
VLSGPGSFDARFCFICRALLVAPAMLAAMAEARGAIPWYWLSVLFSGCQLFALIVMITTDWRQSWRAARR